VLKLAILHSGPVLRSSSEPVELWAARYRPGAASQGEMRSNGETFCSRETRCRAHVVCLVVCVELSISTRTAMQAQRGIGTKSGWVRWPIQDASSLAFLVPATSCRSKPSPCIPGKGTSSTWWMYSLRKNTNQMVRPIVPGDNALVCSSSTPPALPRKGRTIGSHSPDNELASCKLSLRPEPVGC